MLHKPKPKKNLVTEKKITRSELFNLQPRLSQKRAVNGYKPKKSCKRQNSTKQVYTAFKNNIEKMPSRRMDWLFNMQACSKNVS